MGDIILTGFWLIVGLTGVVAGAFVYGLPTIIAVWRKSPNIVPIFIVNLFGALFVPWLIALGMALWSSDRRGDVTVIQTTNVPQTPPAVLPSTVQASPYVQAHGALPAASPTQPSTAPAPVGDRDDRPYRQQPPSPPGIGFAPPALYSAAPPTSTGSPWPSPDQGW